VALRTPNKIVLAADSKSIYDDRPPTVDCKIYQLRDTYFAIAGIPYETDTEYNVPSFVVTACEQCAVTERANALEKRLKPALEKELARIRLTRPRVFWEAWFDAGAPPVSLVLVAFEGGEPRLVVKEFTVASGQAPDIRIAVRTATCPGTCPTGTHGYYLGSTKAINAFIAEGKGQNWPSGWEELARTLVQLEIDSNQKEVGPPIDILSITKDGVHWTQKQKSCPDVQTQPTHKPSPPVPQQKPELSERAISLFSTATFFLAPTVLERFALEFTKSRHSECSA